MENHLLRWVNVTMLAIFFVVLAVCAAAMYKAKKLSKK